MVKSDKIMRAVRWLENPGVLRDKRQIDARRRVLRVFREVLRDNMALRALLRD